MKNWMDHLKFNRVCQVGLLICISLLGPGLSFGAPIEGVHPAYNMETLRLQGFTTKGANAFEPQVTSLAFLSDGTLLMATISKETQALQTDFLNHGEKFPGYIYALRNLTTNSTGELDVEIVANITTGLGLAVDENDNVYVQEWNSLNRLVDNNEDGVYESKDAIFNNFVTEGERQWTFGPAYKDGYLYMAPGISMQAGVNTFPATFEYSGQIIKVPVNGGQEESFASGFRNPDGLFIGPEGELFTTDDQGTYRPSSGFIHVQEGGYYGHPSFNSDNNRQMTNGITWMIHREISQSPHGPLYVTEGIHRGQVYVPEIAYGNTVNRVFLERVDGVYQGNVHHFTGDLLAGGRQIVYGPDGNYYVGCLGNGESGNWGWNGAKWGFHRLVPNGNVPFEMLAVRSMGPNSYEIEFTKPVQANVSASNFSVQQYGFQPQSGYGAGNKVNPNNPNLTGVSRSQDGLKVTLEFSGGALREQNMSHIRISGLRSESGESPWSSETWYQLNRFGPADKPGCLDPAYDEYDASADYDPGSGVACISLSTDIKDKTFAYRGRDGLLKTELQGGQVHLSWPAGSLESLEFYNAQGQKLNTVQVADQTAYTLDGGLSQSGLVLIKGRGEGFQWNQKVMVP